MSRRDRRQLKSRLSKLLRSMHQLGKYSLPVVAMSLMGCVPPPNAIHVSDDGRYVIVPYTAEGVNIALEKNSTLVMIDLHTNTVSTLGQDVKSPFWIDHHGDNVVFTYLDDDDKPVVRLIEGLNRTDIKAAAYPTFSPDGQWLAYSTITDVGEEHDTIYLRNLKAGNRADVKTVKGIPAGFSPDGKHLLYMDEVEHNGTMQWVLMVYRVDDPADARQIAVLDSNTTKTFLPKWMDDNRVIYRSRNAQSPKDGEMYIADMQGHVHQLTDNDIEESHAQLINERRMIYTVTPTADTLDDIEKFTGQVWLAERGDEQWQHRKVDNLADVFYLTTGGQKAVCIQKTGDKYHLLAFEVDQPDKRIDLNEVVFEQLPELSHQQ